MKNDFIKFCSLLLVLFITGCVPYYKLSKKEFPQGDDLQATKEIAKNFVKSQSVYDQFTTLAKFDVMWLSDAIRVAYVDLVCQKRGKSQDARDALLNRQLEENRHWISFYVLADIRDDVNSSLTDKNPVWTPYLEIDGTKFEPVTIKEIELEPEYVNLFDGNVNSFKTEYLVSFAAQDLAGKFYLKDHNSLKFVISSVEKMCSVTWDLNKVNKNINQKKCDKKGSKRNIDFYWGK